MFLWNVEASVENYVRKKLPRRGLRIDPRPISILGDCDMTFDIAYDDNGTVETVTFTRGESNTKNNDEWDMDHEDEYEDGSYGWDHDLKFRVYDPTTEVVPSFESTIYTYHSVKGERVPLDTVIGIINGSVKVIKTCAFQGCKKMKICLMHDNVEEIQEFAFAGCQVMKTIRLSTNLKSIGKWAFDGCISLDALFIPPTIEQIHGGAFIHCRKLRILSLPPNIHTDQIGCCVLDECDTFFRVTQIERNRYDSDNELHQAILNFYRNYLPPLHKVCLDTDVTSEKIHDAIRAHGSSSVATLTACSTAYGGMTPLHILVMNPHASTGTILEYLDWNVSAALVEDDSGKTPVDYVREYENVEAYMAFIQTLCMKATG